MNHLSVLLAHKLKQDFQPDKQTRSREAAIKIQRLDVRRVLRENLSLKSSFDETVRKAYERAVLIASKETGLDQDVLLTERPYRRDELLT